MNTTPDYNGILERFMTSPDFESYLQRAQLAGESGQPSWVELHEDGTWTFMTQREVRYGSASVPLLIYWSVKPKDPKEELRADLDRQLKHHPRS